MDTDVLVAAFRSPTGASREIVRLLYEGIIEGAASMSLMLEYEEVMLRPEQRQAMGLDVSDYFPAAQYFRLEVLQPAEFLRRL